jgi:Domain of unknown function (DUF4386)
VEAIDMATVPIDTEVGILATGRIPRVLGAMFLIVVATSLVGGTLLSSAIGSDGSAVVAGASDNQDLLRLAVLVDLATAIGIVALAGLLYAVLAVQDRTLAIIAFGLWLMEAALMVASRLAALALVPLGQAHAGSTDPTVDQLLGETIYEGLIRTAYSIHMLFYCAGGLVWYALFYRSHYLPRVIPLFGLVAVVLALAGTVLQLLGASVPLVVFLPLLPFELTIGGWLLWRGVATGTSASARLGPAAMQPGGA